MRLSLIKKKIKVIYYFNNNKKEVIESIKEVTEDELKHLIRILAELKADGIIKDFEIRNVKKLY